MPRLLTIILTLAIPLAAAEPWPRQYLIQPWEADRLTASDVVGPDGIVYPDWRRCGVPGGIPDLARPDVLAAYREFPVAAGADEQAIAAAITAAKQHAQGGGKALVRLAAGTYRLTKALPRLDVSHVILAGAGIDQTILEIGGGTGSIIQTGPASPWSGLATQVPGLIPRGTTVLRPAKTAGFAIGDAVYLGTVMPKDLPPDATMRRRYDWPAAKVFYGNQANGHFGRGLLARIAAVDGEIITLDRPTSHDLYADEPVELRRTAIVRGVGIQDLSVVTAAGVGADAVAWGGIAESWLLRVAIRKAANWPLGYGSGFRLNCEIRDCVFDGTQADIGRGSTAYLGWCGVMNDCLMIGVKANDLRHMAIFQGAIRCVVRDCTFTGKTVMSPQFHGQLPHDNLIEGCTFDVQSEVWAVDGMSTLRHGVQGPRNVLYRCRFPSSASSAVFFGGVEGHILAYNRWGMGANAAWRVSPVMAYDRTWNTIIRGNVVQSDPRYPFASLNDQSCIGWDIRGNTVHGSNGLVAQGDGTVAVNDANRVLPVDAPMAEPRPEAASIIDWQRAHADQPRLVVVPAGSSVLAPGHASALRVVRVRGGTDAVAVRLTALPPGLLDLPATATIPAGAGHADVPVRRAAGAGEVVVTASAEGLLADDEHLTVLDAPADPAQWLRADGDHRLAGLPEPWRLTDLGRAPADPSPPTVANWADGRLTLRGGGVACSVDRNIRLYQRTQCWQSVDGDAVITARLESATATAQAGLIITDDIAPRCEGTVLLADGTVLSTGADNQYAANYANVRNGDGGTAPVWLRLVRRGGVFTAWRATAARPADGDWTRLAEIDVYADPPKGQEHYRSNAKWDARIHVGLLLNTTKQGEAAEAVWSSLAVSRMASP